MIWTMIPLWRRRTDLKRWRVRVEVGKRRKVARNGRFTNGRAAGGGGGF